MRKTYIFMVFALCAIMLTGCLQERFSEDKLNIVYADEETKDLIEKISEIDIEEYGHDDLINLLGNPQKYIWGEEEFDSNDLPEYYIIIYSEDFHIFMIDDQIEELRFYNSPNYIMNSLHVGQSIEEVLKILGKPKKVVIGEECGFEDGILYKDIVGREGFCYYSRLDKNVRMFFKDNKIYALYVLSSKNYFSEKNKKDKAETQIQERVNVDKIDYPFTNDEKIIGTWNSVDFVKDIEKFDPNKREWIGKLILKDLVFEENGKTSESFWTWTNGIIIHYIDETASKYVIKEINGETYMFLEWKNGDYIYRGMKPNYYVLKKEKE